MAIANREANLTKRIRTADGKRYCPVVISANGRIKQDLVLVDGREERHPEGAYYISWYEARKLVRRSVGRNASDAHAKMLRKAAELNAVSSGVPVLKENDRHSQPLVIAASEYLADVKLTHKPRSYAAYKTALDYFLASCHKPSVHDIDRRDLIKFSAFLREEKDQAPRSVYNKFEHVMTFLKSQGIRGLVGKNDWPRYTEEEPEIYEQDDLDKLFAACDAEEQLWYEFFLMTGEREQEVMYTYWSDINFSACTARVTHKPDRGWSPKAYKERTIPIPLKLAKKLKARKAKLTTECNLVFGTSRCQPKLNFWDCLKAIAKRAHIDPATCWLHKFRSTFATRCLWEGVDLRTVQNWLGHKDIESTMRYLKPSRSQATRAKVNAIFS